jgi:hypothetical protein
MYQSTNLVRKLSSKTGASLFAAVLLFTATNSMANSQNNKEEQPELVGKPVAQFSSQNSLHGPLVGYFDLFKRTQPKPKGPTQNASCTPFPKCKYILD